MCQRTSLKTHHFILAKLLRFQRTFHEKSFVSGVWGGSPNLLFFRRKVCQRTSLKTHHFILAKLLRFQRTFPEKSFVSGFGADSPNLLFFRRKVRQRTSLKTHHFILVKLLSFQRTFHEKSFVSGFGADALTYNAHKKHGIAVLFLLSFVMSWNCVPNLALRGFFEKSSLKIRKNFPHRRATSLWQKLLSSQIRRAVMQNTPYLCRIHLKIFILFPVFLKKSLYFPYYFAIINM